MVGRNISIYMDEESIEKLTSLAKALNQGAGQVVAGLINPDPKRVAALEEAVLAYKKNVARLSVLAMLVFASVWSLAGIILTYTH